jgi:hypothetical protein
MRKLAVTLFVTAAALGSMAPAALAEDEPRRGACNRGTMNAHATVPHETSGNMVAHNAIPHCH